MSRSSVGSSSILAFDSVSWLELVDLLLSSDFLRLVYENARKQAMITITSALPMPAPNSTGSLLG